MILCSDPRNTSTSKLDTEDRYQNEAPKWRSLSLKVIFFLGKGFEVCWPLMGERNLAITSWDVLKLVFRF